MASHDSEQAAASNGEPLTRDGRPADPTQEPDAEISADLDLSIFDSPRAGASLGRIGKYDVLEVVGHGGMGVVVRGFDPDLGRPVAIKVLNRRLAASGTARRRFLREGKAAAAVNHPNVLTIHSVEEHRGTPFLVMEYVAGKSLKEYIDARGRLDPQETLRLGTQIALGLAAAHAQGVIHRDVKPGNVMLHEGATRVRLADFGLARVTFDMAELTSAGAAIGTPAYMAPEQVRGEPVDGRADLFSLGCVFYAMLTGRSPFAGRTHAETIHKILNTEPEPLANQDSPPPPVLCEVVDKLLQKDPANRIQTAQEVAEVLFRFQTEMNRARTDEMAQVLGQPLTPLAPAAQDDATLSSVGPPAPRPVFRPWLVFSGLALLGLVAWGWYVWEGGRTGGPAATESSSHEASVKPDPDESRRTPPPPTALLSEITVAQDGSGQFRSLGEALAHAAEGATITVLDQGPYTESLSLEGRPNGLTLVASQRAVLRSPAAGDRTLLRLRDIRDVTVRGFQLETAAGNGADTVLIMGTVSATFEELQFVPSSEARGEFLMRCDAQGPDTRFVVRRCRLTLPPHGKAIWIEGGAPPGSVEIVDNQFTGPVSQVVVFGSCRRLRIAGNVFDGGTNAINLDLQRWHADTHLEITNNTFVRTQFWLGLLQTFKTSQPPQPGTARVCNNLILGGERIQGADEQLEHALTQWQFAANWWERDATTKPGADREGRIAQSADSLAVPERDAADAPGFLCPQPGSPLASAGLGGDLPKYVGAKAPQP